MLQGTKRPPPSNIYIYRYTYVYIYIYMFIRIHIYIYISTHFYVCYPDPSSMLQIYHQRVCSVLQISRSRSSCSGSWSDSNNALVLTLEGGVAKRCCVIHTLCSRVCNGCGPGPCYIPPILGRTHICISVYVYVSTYTRTYTST